MFLTNLPFSLDSQYVLANYKTEPCKRPPRLCRQGYACPQYHNSKDRRRNPHAYKYRSTPCPQVKQHDEWGDPAVCEQGDDCQYCHTRTEQQFYPEVGVNFTENSGSINAPSAIEKFIIVVDTPVTHCK